jgi:hypothetical protein
MHAHVHHTQHMQHTTQAVFLHGMLFGSAFGRLLGMPSCVRLWVPAGEPVDTTFVDTYGATVYFSPGNRTHFEFILREGFRVGGWRGWGPVGDEARGAKGPA